MNVNILFLYFLNIILLEFSKNSHNLLLFKKYFKFIKDN